MELLREMERGERKAGKSKLFAFLRYSELLDGYFNETLSSLSSSGRLVRHGILEFCWEEQKRRPKVETSTSPESISKTSTFI